MAIHNDTEMAVESDSAGNGFVAGDGNLGCKNYETLLNLLINVK